MDSRLGAIARSVSARLSVMKKHLLSLLVGLTLVFPAALPAADRVALVLGCSDYNNSAATKPPRSANDAADFVNTLRTEPMKFEFIVAPNFRILYCGDSIEVTV